MTKTPNTYRAKGRTAYNSDGSIVTVWFRGYRTEPEFRSGDTFAAARERGVRDGAKGTFASSNPYSLYSARHADAWHDGWLEGARA